MLFSFFNLFVFLRSIFLRYAVAFTSSLAPSHENLTIGDKVSTEEKSGNVDSITIDNVVKSEYSELGPRVEVDSEYCEIVPRVEVESEYCEIVPRVHVKSEYSEYVPRVKEESEYSGMVPRAEVKSEYSEIFPPFEEVKHQCEEFVHLSKGTLNLQVPSRLVGVWVAFDSTFLPTLNTVFVFRLNKDGQVLTNTLILQLTVLVS